MSGRNPKKGSGNLDATPRRSGISIPKRLNMGTQKRDALISQAIRRLSSRSSETRISAAFELGDFGDRRAVQHLIPLLIDTDPEVRRVACLALGEIHDPKSAGEVMKRLRDVNVGVRIAAAEALGRIRNPDAVSPLLRSLKDKSAMVRRAVVEAIGNIGEGEVAHRISALLAGGTRDPSHYVRIAAARVLGKLADRDIVDDLRSAARFDQNVLVRMTASHSLHMLEAPAS